MANTPGVSVIIATYNVQNYIERALRSALDQQNVNIEIILADDASTDNTVATVERLNDPRIKILRRATNGGPSITRNDAIAAATMPWLAILDGDDAFAPNRLIRCLARAELENADIIVDNIETRREFDGARAIMFEPKDFGLHPTLDLATFIAGNPSFLGGKALGYLKPIFSKSFLQNHDLRYDPEIRVGEDYILLAESLASGACCAIEPTAGYIYTVRAGSISHRLTMNDINRIAAGDKKFLARHRLDLPAQKAQKNRTSALADAAGFTQLIDALKRRDVIAALKHAAARPKILWYLWRPIEARIKRLIGQ